jgi:toxin ParE1/3/4
MSQPRLSARALADLDHIFRWAATDSVAAAASIVEEIEAACIELAAFPDRYPVRAKPRGRSLRRRPVHRYNIYYEVTPSGVRVVRILHSAREVRQTFPDN